MKADGFVDRKEKGRSFLRPFFFSSRIKYWKVDIACLTMRFQSEVWRNKFGGLGLSNIKSFLVLVLAVVMTAPTITAAQDLSISAFKGDWRGNAVSESNVSVSFPITSRDIDVNIKPTADGDFSITWRTLLRQKGTPEDPTEVLKETTLTFVKTDKKNVWKDSKAGDVYAGHTVSWAQLKKQTLTVYVMSISESGGYDMQIYKRTLTGVNMELDFTAIRDGAIRRTAKGQLVLNSY